MYIKGISGELTERGELGTHKNVIKPSVLILKIRLSAIQVKY